MPDFAAAVGAPIDFLFAIVRHWRRATEQRRWPFRASIEETDDTLLNIN